MAPQISLVILEIERSLQRDAWHGPSLGESLEGISFGDAVATPINGAHSVADLVWHIAAWMEEVTARLQGEFHEDPVRGNFPPALPRDEAEWAVWLELPATAFAALRAAAENFPESRLHETISPSEYAGRVPTYWETLIGVAQHNAYHIGQIVLLRRSFG